MKYKINSIRSENGIKLTTVDLITIFNRLFSSKYSIQLEGGADEPMYLPANSTCKNNRLIFRSDYISSALHEIAHWCLAGEKRRKLKDYGYWYHADGRSDVQQKIFEEVEIKPQALEWIFSVALNHSFNVSTDNLTEEARPSQCFLKAVSNQAHVWCVKTMPNRALMFTSALTDFSGTDPLHSFFYQFPRN